MSATNTGRWAFEPAAIPSLPIRGSDALFPGPPDLLHRP